MSIPENKQPYTYKDYLAWDEGERVEIIDGEIFNMSPASSRKHQQVLREIAIEFSLFLRGKECEAFFAPFDVQLLAENKENDEILNVVQPDLTIVCDKNKLTDKGCKGTPDMIVEILSPASVKLDRWKKFKLYEMAGVKEYWIVDITNEAIEVYVLEKDRYAGKGVFTREDAVSVETIKGLGIDIDRIFATAT